MLVDWDIIRRIIEAILAINAVLAFWTVFRSHRDIASTWAWLLVLTIFPYVGFIAYLFVGRQLSHDKIFSIQEEQAALRNRILRKQRQLIAGNKHIEHKRERQLVDLFLSTNDALLTTDNQVKIFTDGQEKFDSLIADINAAEDHVLIEYYSFYADNLGKRILTALEHAAQRGVQVRVLYDMAGSRGTTYKFFTQLEAYGGLAQAFASKAKARFTTPRMNYHLHRKLAIIDGQIGYIGGFNIGDQYLGEDPKFGYWRDTHLRVVGQAVKMMTVRFAMDWNTTCRGTDKPRINIEDQFKNFEVKPPLANPDLVPMQIVASGPDNEEYAIRRGYEAIIGSAKQYIYIQTPYLIPEDSYLEALIIAARSGVDVRIMIPCMPDHPFVYRATEYYAKYLVENGVKVYKYDKGFLHAKTMVSGNDIASVGSANMDYRSFRLNFEVNAFAYNKKLTAQLKQIFEDDLQDCTLLTEEYFAQQSSWRKFKQHFSRMLSPIL
ncbi:cardiolipin synthase [Ligilactobacillus saerimneri]|uniref:cardiolipin synthase n=2 Tax=Ligilactobacillus saerimneri TaxID=228229 RepID=UPI0004096974|nr:cardiolipin synthase [Ligilactobacillus saerimneri]